MYINWYWRGIKRKWGPDPLGKGTKTFLSVDSSPVTHHLTPPCKHTRKKKKNTKQTNAIWRQEGVKEGILARQDRNSYKCHFLSV